MRKFAYDIETFPNCFLIGMQDMTTGAKLGWEYSWRRNMMPELYRDLFMMRSEGDQMVGFNNMGFDYPILHWLIENRDQVLSGIITPFEIYLKAKEIIEADWDDRFRFVVWEKDQHIPQIDLYKIHHFDNPSRATSLKVLEFNMRRRMVEDLPFDPDRILDWLECDTLINYMFEDIDATADFLIKSSNQIRFREELSEKYGRNWMNCSDPKIGEQFIIMQLQEMIPGFDKDDRTFRGRIHLKDVIFPYIQFNHPEFNRILSWFKSQTLIGTKGAFKDVHCTVRGFQFDFGTGGIHGSIESSIVESDENYIIEDWDVASYYPNIGIKNGIYPEHLGRVFCRIYEDVYHQRKLYPKGSPENAMLKLALNATYGKSNSLYSCFYDPQYTMSITINGQLMLCMLAEKLMAADEVQMIQINTDGLTIRYPRVLKDWVHAVADWWQGVTQLDLESEEYSKMCIRDVNSYIGVYANGKIKRKGAYAWKFDQSGDNNKGLGDLDWSQNHSALIVAKAAEAALLHGEDIKSYVEMHGSANPDDYFDFMLRTKVPRSSRLVGVDYYGNDIPYQNVSRYFISVMGVDLIKVMPPTPAQLRKDPAAPDRRIGINAGWKATICNNMDHFNPDDLEFDYYIQEAEKLVKPLRR